MSVKGFGLGRFHCRGICVYMASI